MAKKTIANLNPTLFSKGVNNFTPHFFSGLVEGENVNEQGISEDCYLAMFTCTITGEERIFGCYEPDDQAMYELFGVPGPRSAN